MMERIVVEATNPNPMVGATQDWVRQVIVNDDVAIAFSLNRMNGHKEERGTIQFAHFSDIEQSIKDFTEYKEEMFF